MPRRVPRPLLLIVLLAAGLRVPHLFENLWYDETFSLRMAQMDWPQFWAAAAKDIHPPLHHILLNVWGRIGGYSTFWLRLPELACGLVSVLLMYHVARALQLDKRVSLLAALVLAVMPSAIYFSVELRAYSIVACLLLASLLAALRNRPGWFLALSPLMYLTHHYGLFYAAVLALAAFGYWRRREWFITGLCLAVGVLLWLPAVFSQSGVVADGYWIYNSPGNVINSFIDMLTKAPGKYARLNPPVAALLFASFYAARRWLVSRPGLLWSSLVFGVPVLATVVSYVFAPVFSSRYVFPSMTLLAIPIAIAISKSQLLGRVGLALALVGVGIGFDSPRTPFTDLAAEYCPNATAYYHLNMEAAFILSYVAPEAQHLVLPQATDQGANLMPSDITTFGFTPGDIEQFYGQTVCVMSIDSALTMDYERWWVRWLTRRYPYTTGAFFDRGFDYVFYQFDVR